MTKIKHFFLNGESYQINEEINLLDLITYFDFNNHLLVLEYNNLICEKKHWKTTFIQSSDKIEIVTIVGGG
jgi:sulfur carrier protein